MNIPFFTLSGIKTQARLVDVYDGDTITCIFPIFGENYYKFKLRLMGIDTYELKNNNIEGKQKALDGRHKILTVCCDTYNLDVDCHRNEIQNFLKSNEIYVWIECFEFDKYGRVLANVYKTQGDISLSELLLNSQLAYKYGGRKLKN